MKLVLRNLLKNKKITFINLLGLSKGFAACLLIILFVKHELDYDSHHKNADSIFRITTDIKTGGDVQKLALCPMRLNSILKNEYPEVEEAAYVCELVDRDHITFKNNHFYQNGIREASPEVFNIFTYPMLVGNPATALSQSNSIVLTESLALKIFGNLDVINQTILLGDQASTVTGVIRDVPKNSDIQFTALIPSPYSGEEDLLDFEGLSYIKIKNGADDKLADILKDIEERYYKPMYDNILKGAEINFHAQPLKSIHFSDELLADGPKGSKTLLIVLSVIAFLILGVSCINYINLSLGQSSQNLKSIAITSIIGAKRKEIYLRKLAETSILVTITLLLGFVLTFLFVPILNTIITKDISIADLFQTQIIIVIVGISLFIVGVSALIPAISLSRTSALSIIQNSKLILSAKYKPVLVTFQFTVSIIMIFTLLLFHKQLHFMETKNMGFNMEKTVAIEIPDYVPDASSKSKLFKEELQTHPWIDKISYGTGGSLLGEKYGGEKMLFANEVKGLMKQFVIHFLDADKNYLELLGIELIKGENFSTIQAKNLSDYIIINETYAREFEIQGNELGVCPHEESKTIIGVVKDFNFMSLHNKVEPLCIRFSDNNRGLMFLKTAPQNLSKVEKIWKKHFPETSFATTFLSDNFLKEYAEDKKTSKLIGYFTWISILITCLGLYGTALLESTRRVKEIGIRKINGAKIIEILSALNQSTIKWVAIAFVIASPIAWYAMSKWLENFAYKTEISWWIFALAGLIALVIALVTVSFQSYQAARKNPVEALRYE